MLKFTALESLIKNAFRVIKGETYKNIIHYAKQYHSGGEDYNPPYNTNCIATTLNNNDAETIVFLYNDNTARISNKGEKRIYSTDSEGKQIKATIHLKNTGDITIETTAGLTISTTTNTTINTKNIVVNGDNINLTGKSITAKADNITLDGTCSLGGTGGAAVVLETSVILDSLGKPCTITKPATKTKAL